MARQGFELVAARAFDENGAADRHSPVLIARRDLPAHFDASDPDKVVQFAPRRSDGATPILPLARMEATDRVTSFPPNRELGRWATFTLVSMAVHGLLLSALSREAPPRASIGVEVINVEVVLGATTAAGLALQPGEQEVQPAQSSEQVAQVDEPANEGSQAATLMPQEVPVAARDTAPEAEPQETPPEPQAADPQPSAPKDTQPEATVPDTAAETAAIEKPPEPAVQPSRAPPVQAAAERKRISAPTKKKAQQEKQRASAPPTDAASGVGRGRSDNSANYNGMVAAHLARYKQYPAGARSAGVQGVATVSFSIDGGGRVTSARLAGGSGSAALDQEVVAMARRASPFPAPPDGRGRSFTIPVRFNLR